MVRVNGKKSAAVLTNMYPDALIGQEVLHLHMDAPDTESAVWETDDHLNIEAEWQQELGGVRYAPQQGLAAVLAARSVQGQFVAHVRDHGAGGRLLVALKSIGLLRPWDPSRCLNGTADETIPPVPSSQPSQQTSGRHC